MFTKFAVILFTLHLCLNTIAADESKLAFVHVIFRHGDRTPVEPYPTDPWGKPEFWETGWGQLTNLGKQQHFELGQWLRKRYAGLVNETYSRDEIYIRSTDVDRTLMSALSNLDGFYPPVGRQVWQKDAHWQPIPVHTVPEKSDAILAAKKNCPSYDYALKKLKQSDEYEQFDKKHKKLYDYLTLHTGRTVGSMEAVQTINNCLFIEELYNRTLPEWTNAVYPGEMPAISARAFTTNTHTPQLARLKTGPLLKEILTRSINKTIGKLSPNRSMWIYSAHDTTVANVLNTLGLFEMHNPPYRACIMIELHLIDQRPYISVFYKNTSAEPEAMYIPNCGPRCPLDKMFELYEAVLPVDWEQECQLSMLSMPYVDVDFDTTLLVMASVIALLGLALLLIMAVIYYRQRVYADSRWYYRIDGF